jgi:hypothetical protein
MNFRTCTKCNITKKLDEFRFLRTTGLNGYIRYECKECEKSYSKGRLKAHKYAPAKPNKCDLCGIEGRKLVMDHNHDTHMFRGWICQNCNKGIGGLGDNVEMLEKAIQYLLKNNQIPTVFVE